MTGMMTVWVQAPMIRAPVPAIAGCASAGQAAEEAKRAWMDANRAV
jgi:hypothetical protein